MKIRPLLMVSLSLAALASFTIAEEARKPGPAKTTAPAEPAETAARGGKGGKGRATQMPAEGSPRTAGPRGGGHHGGQSVPAAVFSKMDIDGDGSLDIKEFGVSPGLEAASREDVAAAYQKADIDKNGSVSLDEFAKSAAESPAGPGMHGGGKGGKGGKGGGKGGKGGKGGTPAPATPEKAAE